MEKIKTVLKSILMIDPEEINNKTLISIFSEYGISLDIIDTSQDILEFIDNKHYDCIMINNSIKFNDSFKILDLVKSNYPWIVAIIILNLNQYTFEGNTTNYNNTSIIKNDEYNNKKDFDNMPNEYLNLQINNGNFQQILNQVFELVRNGADDFIIKPFIWQDIEKILKFYYY
ncbi:MAG: hypothetical protein PHY08_11955 [Candidatus Cloacimonetes bacterium]|jgi:CheY-like chemotaxis protein|nr:hypothetical protein [Candidatus Cloacimonadota bacterium]MDD4157276.1 hypothetical protein [Candidatus Cloacimonadota bacterium]